MGKKDTVPSELVELAKTDSVLQGYLQSYQEAYSPELRAHYKVLALQRYRALREGSGS